MDRQGSDRNQPSGRALAARRPWPTVDRSADASLPALPHTRARNAAPTDSPCAAAGPPRHSLRPMPPLRPTTWLKDDSLRTASLQNMVRQAGVCGTRAAECGC